MRSDFEVKTKRKYKRDYVMSYKNPECILLLHSFARGTGHYPLKISYFFYEENYFGRHDDIRIQQREVTNGTALQPSAKKNDRHHLKQVRL